MPKTVIIIVIIVVSLHHQRYSLANITFNNNEILHTQTCTCHMHVASPAGSLSGVQF